MRKTRRCPCVKGFRRFGSGRSDGCRYAPKPRAIPTSLHPDIHFSAMIPRRGVKIKIFLSVVIPVVKAAFVPLSAIVENPLSPALQGFAVFRSDPSRIPPRHTPITCHTNWATPEYNYIIPWADQKKQEKSVCPHWGHTDFDDVGPPRFWVTRGHSVWRWALLTGAGRVRGSLGYGLGSRIGCRCSRRCGGRRSFWIDPGCRSWGRPR